MIGNRCSDTGYSLCGSAASSTGTPGRLPLQAGRLVGGHPVPAASLQGPHPCCWLLVPLPPLAQPCSLPERRWACGLQGVLFLESVSNSPPIYGPLEPRWLPAACWSVEIHTPTGNGSEHTGFCAGHQQRLCGWRLPTRDHRDLQYPAGRRGGGDPVHCLFYR